MNICSVPYWAEYSPMLDNNPNPPFSKTSEILKISDNFEWQLVMLNLQFDRFMIEIGVEKVWKKIVEQSCCQQPNPIQ